MNVIYCLSVLYTLPTIHDHHLQHCSTEGRCQYSLHQCQSNRKGRESEWKTGARRRWDKRIWSHRQLAPCWRLFQFPMNHTRTCLQSSLKYLWKTQTDHDMRQGHTSAKTAANKHIFHTNRYELTTKLNVCFCSHSLNHSKHSSNYETKWTLNTNQSIKLRGKRSGSIYYSGFVFPQTVHWRTVVTFGSSKDNASWMSLHLHNIWLNVAVEGTNAV